MEWAKIKNIIILILLTVNILLLGLLSYRESTSRAQNTELLTDAVTILADNGIRLNAALVPTGAVPSALSMERDLSLEAALAEQFLGVCRSEAAGSTYTYASASGSAVFRSTGDFMMTYAGQGAPTAEGILSDHGITLLQSAGLSCQFARQHSEGSRTQVMLYQLWNNVPVFTCQFTLTYEGQSLLSIQGRRLMSEQGSRLSQNVLSSPTALVRFLSAILTSGEVCNEITGIQPGYQMTVGLTEPITLRPIWQFTTDTGRFEMDLTTGETTRVA